MEFNQKWRSSTCYEGNKSKLTVTFVACVTNWTGTFESFSCVTASPKFSTRIFRITLRSSYKLRTYFEFVYCFIFNCKSRLLASMHHEDLDITFTMRSGKWKWTYTGVCIVFVYAAVASILTRRRPTPIID